MRQLLLDLIKLVDWHNRFDGLSRYRQRVRLYADPPPKPLIDQGEAVAEPRLPFKAG